MENSKEIAGKCVNNSQVFGLLKCMVSMLTLKISVATCEKNARKS